MEHETKSYADGTTATCPGPLPDMSPAEQDAAHQCCGKCEKPAADATEATVTDEQFRVIIDDLAHRLQTADAVIIALVQAADGEVTIKGEDSAKVIGHQIVSEVSEDRQSFTFRAVPVPAPAVQ